MSKGKKHELQGTMLSLNQLFAKRNIETQPTKEDEEATVASKRIRIQDLLKDEYNPTNGTATSVERKQQPERTSRQTDAPTTILRVCVSPKLHNYLLPQGLTWVSSLCSRRSRDRNNISISPSIL
ncbi:hypothetical protein CLU79DRAFT_759525, partial [Phycomyces nitens]